MRRYALINFAKLTVIPEGDTSVPKAQDMIKIWSLGQEIAVVRTARSDVPQ